MTGSSQSPQNPHTFAEKIFGINPYSQDDPNHDAWESNARLAAEEEARFEADLLKRTPVTPEEWARYVQDGMIGHFDILARRLLMVKFRSAESIAIYEEYLTKMTESMLTRADERCPPSVPKAPFLFELHRQFRQRIAHWTAEALTRMREGMTNDRVSQVRASVEHGLPPGTQSAGAIAHGVERGSDNAKAPTDANRASNTRKGQRKRGPDKRKHQERVDFEDAVRSELAAVRKHLGDSASTLEELRKRFPDYKLWTVLSLDEQTELLQTDFKPKAYARTLTTRRFAVGEEAIKKSRQTLNRLRDKPSANLPQFPH